MPDTTNETDDVSQENIFRWVRELGIPSAMCVVLCWFVWWQTERNYKLGEDTQQMIVGELRASTAALTKSSERDDRVAQALTDAARSKDRIADTTERLCELVAKQTEVIESLVERKP